MRLSLREVVLQTEHTTRVLSGGRPHLIPLGIPQLDNVIGGMSPGTLGALGALDGTGKSTVSLFSAFERSKRRLKTAILSMQDSADVVGQRLLSYMTGVNSLKMRRGDVTVLERKQIIEAADRLTQEEHIHTFFPHARLEECLASIRDAAEEGCDLIWLDYIQAMSIADWRGDRRNEIDRMLQELRNVALDTRVSIMILSQMRKLPPKSNYGGSKAEPDESYRKYTRSDFKESSAIGEQSRLCLILEKDRVDSALTHCFVDKSSFGGDHITASFRRHTSGMLVTV